ncbi:MAG: hydrogenase nickel incorporation protein HypB [Chrysiogenales bacterium]|nr:MAG: hydrogenase nickel incorporation protein HypB [Chrysiogenales bacterium]
MEVKILQDIFESNKNVAAEVKTLLGDKGIYMIDMMSSPGSGKTTLIDSLIHSLKGKYRIAVIEGDIKTTKDADRLARHDIPIFQIETDRFGGDCHLESSWVKRCLEQFDLDSLDLVIIENIGNLVCPAEFQLGDDERMVILSVTEGEDKPAKYPLMFNTSDTLVLSKIDLLPHLEFDMAELMDNIRSVNPKISVFRVSSKTGEGIEALLDHISGRIDRKKKDA